MKAAIRANSPRALLAFQRTLQAAVTQPLAPGHRTARRASATTQAAEFIKPNDRLTAVDRLEIYNRMYWFRLIDCFHDDNPGLRAALGERRFERLMRAYLAKHPSRSFTLRNLCDRLERFIRAEPRWSAPRTALAADIAAFEWAQTCAFDEAAKPALTAADFADIAPARLKLGLQPHVTLLALRYPVDDYVIAVKRRDALRAEASNATAKAKTVKAAKRVALPRAARTHLAVHRMGNRLYYKRLDPAAWKILRALHDGAPLTRAVAAGGRSVKPEQVQEWFALWTELGWLCRRD